MLIICVKILSQISHKKLAGWVETGWVGGWMDGWESGFKDCLQQSKMVKNSVANFMS